MTKPRILLLACATSSLQGKHLNASPVAAGSDSSLHHAESLGEVKPRAELGNTQAPLLPLGLFLLSLSDQLAFSTFGLFAHPIASRLAPARSTRIRSSAGDDASQRVGSYEAQQMDSTFALDKESLWKMQRDRYSQYPEHIRKKLAKARASDVGTQFGYGPADTSDYGYGREEEIEDEDDERWGWEIGQSTIGEGVPKWLAAEQSGSKSGSKSKMSFSERRKHGLQKGYGNVPDVGSSASGGGFQQGPWAGVKKNKEKVDPNPPPMANTVREMTKGARSALTIEYDRRFRAIDTGDLRKAAERRKEKEQRR